MHIRTPLVGFLSIYLSLALAQDVNPVQLPILDGNRSILTRFYAKIPDFGGELSRIVAFVNQGSDLYVSTSTSGGLIYKIDQNATVTLWFDVATAILRNTGRRMNVQNLQHGGLRGIAFHPSFAINGLFYVSVMEDRPPNPNDFEYFSNAANPINADSVVLEFTYRHSENVVAPFSYRQVIRIGMPV